MKMIKNIGNNIVNDIRPYWDGPKYGIMKNPLGHVAGMYLLGLTTVLLGSVIIGAVSKELNGD